MTDDPHTGRPPRSMSYVASSFRVLEFALTCDPFVRDRTRELRFSLLSNPFKGPCLGVGDAVSRSSARYCAVGGNICPMARGLASGSLAGPMSRVEGERRGATRIGCTARPPGPVPAVTRPNRPSRGRVALVPVG